MMTKVFYRPEQSSAAATGYSPSAGKPAKVVADWLSRRDIANHIDIAAFAPATDGDLCLAHDPSYAEGVLSCELENGFGNKDPEIAASLRYTVGSMLAAAKHALQERTITVSPTSGFHHAGYSDGGGFCTFNGLVIAAQKMKQTGIAKNVLIIDGDAHFGDGTESCLAATKSGGWVKQITATTDYETANEFFKCIDQKRLMSDYEEFWQDIGSTLVIYQAGADAWEGDPLGAGGSVTIHSFSWATGMASLHWRKKYRDKFKQKEPRWLSKIHPGACSELCQLAIRAGVKLPDGLPQDDGADRA